MTFPIPGTPQLGSPGQGVTARKTQAALTLVGICSHDFDAPSGRVFSDCVRLVLCRVALMFCRHADVLSRSLCHGGHPAVTRDDAGPAHHEIGAIQDDGYASETLEWRCWASPPSAHTNLGRGETCCRKWARDFQEAG